MKLRVLMPFCFVSSLVILLMHPSSSFAQSGSSFFGWSFGGGSEPPSDTTTTTMVPFQQESQPRPRQSAEPQVPATPSALGTSTAPSSSSFQNFTTTNGSYTSGNQSSLNGTTLFSLHPNGTSGLASFLGAEISAFITTSVIFLGAALGRAGCDLKAACLAGSLLPPMQGRDLAMVAAEPLIPEEWKPHYLAAKSSMLQGLDCERFNCF